MLDETMIANIRESGLLQGASGVEKRDQLLREFGFRTVDKAEYALIASCFLPSLVPQDTKAFSQLLRHFKIDYTLLPQEHCCGNVFYRQALDDKSDEELRQANLLGQEFLEKNLHQAQEVGASKVILFCIGCDMVYSQFKNAVAQEILWYPTLLARLFHGGRLELEADYYAGCHYYYRNLGSQPDLDSALAVLKRIEGLRLNQLNHRLCCTRPQQLETLVASIRNKTVITPCGGCAMYLQLALKEKGDYRVVMLPQVVLAAASGEGL
ncbi:MAG: (Fe-S)-binding protein [Chloroflexi bacterium]|nr:(Fe-S)-binding protein [Chloroflexota bacterium]